MKYLATFALGATLIFHTVACAPSEDEQETQSNQVASNADEPKTVFQDTTEILVERIIEEDSIVVGVIIDEENLMSPHDRQPGVAFVGEIEKLNANGGLLGKQHLRSSDISGLEGLLWAWGATLGGYSGTGICDLQM